MICKKCNIPFLLDEDINVCTSCGIFFFNFVNSYDDDAKVYQTEKHKFKYNRMTHFKETLDEILGKQTKRIPNDIFIEIKNEFNPKNTVQKNIAAMRALLKKKKLNCYIKITNNILTNLKIINPPILDDNILQALIFF